MARWSPWGPTRKYKVKLKSMRLHGFGFPDPELQQEKEEILKKEDSNSSSNNKVMAVEVKWKGPTKKKTFPTISFQPLRNVSKDAAVPRNGDPLVAWDEHEFDYTCNFSILPASSKDAKISYGPWGASFHLLLGEESNKKKKKKMIDIGKGTLDLGHLLTVSEMEDGEIHHSVPITYQFDGQPPRQSTLSIVVSFIKMKVSHTWASSCESAVLTIPSSDKPPEGFMMRAKSFRLSQPKKKRTNKSSHDSSTSEESDSPSPASSEIGAPSSSSSPTQLDIPEDKNSGFWIWKRRGNRASFKRAKTTDPLSQLKGDETEGCTSDDGSWEEKELESRDGRAKLKAKVFFASYDQRSEKASGESACAAIVAMFAHWLQANPTSLPTRAVLDELISEGSSEWRRLCQDESRRAEFPDSHLDLDTVLRAGLRPLTVLRERSHVGFFSPDKFEWLKEAKSLDAIWKEMGESSSPPGVYIVSWNDHFFVLKVGPDACYIVDSLGERLYEGCDRAYILELDDSSVMYGKDSKEGEWEVISKGKDCCREFIKRFLAAITVRELEEAEEKGSVSIFKLHERLQIEFHYSSSSSSVPSASTSPTHSPIIDLT